MAGKTGYLKQSASDKLWNGCPATDQHPELCYGISDDFLEFSKHATTARWTPYGDTATSVLGSAETVGLGGVVVMAASADDKWINHKLSTAETGAPFKITKDNHKKLWFGCRVKNTVIDECCIYLGLCDESLQQPFATGTGAENFSATQDGVYWRCLLHGTSDKWDACINHNGTETIVADGLVTSDTNWHTLGFTFDGSNAVKFWSDDEVIGTVAADATNWPHDIGLTPFFGMIIGETAAKVVYVDWIRCVQMR